MHEKYATTVKRREYIQHFIYWYWKMQYYMYAVKYTPFLIARCHEIKRFIRSSCFVTRISQCGYPQSNQAGIPWPILRSMVGIYMQIHIVVYIRICDIRTGRSFPQRCRISSQFVNRNRIKAQLLSFPQEHTDLLQVDRWI